MKMEKTRTSEVSKHVREKTDVFQNTKFCSRMEIVIFTLKQSFSASFKKGPYKTLLFWISRPKSFPVLSYGGAYVDLPFYNVLWPYKCSRAKKTWKKLFLKGHPLKLENSIVSSVFINIICFAQLYYLANCFGCLCYLNGITGQQFDQKKGSKKVF